MDLGLAFLLAFGGPVAGAVLGIAGGLLVWRGRGGWRGLGWALVIIGVLLALIGGGIYYGLAQVNWSL